ncbi:MAG: hypothetical protein GXP48_02970 [Acidobacteria bacterium]|nr:hypothetical protein [Acidobacteriota bacterium]
MKSIVRRFDVWAAGLVCGAAIVSAGAGARAQTLVPVAGNVVQPALISVAAAGRHETVFTVARFGRYAIVASSDQGVGLTLVSRMTGPSAEAGTAGKTDGRLDVFLDRGQYKLVTHGADTGSGTVKVRILPFAEKNGGRMPQLVEAREVRTGLGDLEQRSYWINVTKERWIDIEAGGRALADLRLWRDGSWLVDAAPGKEDVTPREGRPLRVFRLAAHLQPGLYLLSAYGGPPKAWAEESASSPLFLRLGMPRLGTAGRQWHAISGIGIDRWLIRSRAHFIRVEVPEARHLVLSAGPWSADSPFGPPEHVATVEKNSREPAAEVTAGGSPSGWLLVTVRGRAGQPYVLQYFNPQTRVRLESSGRTWVSTVASGPPGDAVDATGIVAEWFPSGHLLRGPAAVQVIHIGARNGWAVRCNLLDPLTVFLKVEDRGSYVVTSTGATARFRIEPFFVYRPPGYKAPAWKPSGASWKLDPGFYVLTADPEKKGIVEMSVKPVSLFDNLLTMLGKRRAPSVEPSRPAVQIGVMQLVRDHSYTLFLNQRPGVKTGLVVRPVPVKIEDPLPLCLRPGEKVRIPVRVSETSMLTAIAEDGKPVRFSLNGATWKSKERVRAGTYTVTLASTRKKTVWCALRATPVRLLAATPLPPVPQASLDRLPNFPKLAAGVPRFFDIDSGERKTFLFAAPADALYRLETTGLLNTAGVLRSRVVPSFAHAGDGGSGRNFLIHRYLGSGTYQVTVTTIGASEGHAGIVLDQTHATDGGELIAGEPARVSLARGEAIAYRFRIDTKGTYRLQSFGLGGFSRCRLEDSDGWPLLRPGGPANLARSFEPGRYRLVVLPAPVALRRVTLLKRIAKPRTYQGHGPHEIALDETVHARWMEPEKGQERRPDVWTFRLPGSTRVTITLSGEMLGTLKRVDASGVREVAAVPPVRGWSGPLKTGTYRLEVRCSRRNNRVDYRLKVSPDALMPGMERTVRAPAEIPVASDGGVIDISSFGRQDVSGQLLDAAGRTIAFSDDRPNDWNFLLTLRLPPGTNTLRVEPVGSHRATTRVRISRRTETVLANAALPVDRELEVYDGVVVIPIQRGGGKVLLASADAGGGEVGLALERAGGKSWRTVVTRTGARPVLVAPLEGVGALRMRIWSLDRRKLAVHLRVTATDPRLVSEGTLARGLRLKPVRGFEPGIAVAAVTLTRPGTLRTRARGVLWSNAAGEPLRIAERGLMPAPNATGWLAAPATNGPAVIRAVRQELHTDGAELTLRMSEGTTVPLDLAAPAGYAVAVIARCLDGQPVVRWSDGPATPTGGGWVARHAALGMTLSPSGTLVHIALQGPLPGPVDVTVSALAFDLPGSQPLSWARSDGSLDRRAVVFELPAGRAELTLSLPAGAVAAIAAGGSVQDVIWGGGSAITQRMDVRGGRLLVAPVEGGGPFTAWLSRPGGKPLALGPGAPALVVHGPASEELRVDVAGAADASRVLRVSVADRVVFLGRDGAVHRGRSLPIGTAAGTLVLRHGAGTVVAWLGTGADAFAGLFGGGGGSPSAVEVPGTITCGTATTVRPDLAKGMLLDIAADGPAAVRLGRGADAITWLQDAGKRHVLVTSDRPVLRIRPLGGPVTVGLEAAAVTTAGEGLGPEALIAPGGARAYRFDVTTPGKIGAGVSSDPDVASAELLTAGGSVLGRGVVLMRKLEPGPYILLISVPARAVGPVRIRPAVVGISRPPTGPPEKVIRQYLAKERSR